jgi:sodium/proline symporter
VDKTTNLDAVDKNSGDFYMAISTPMLVTFIVYIFGMVLIGFIAWRSTKNFDDYILGGRSLGPFVTALSAGASDMSGWLLMGLPGRYLFPVFPKAGLPLA